MAAANIKKMELLMKVNAKYLELEAQAKTRGSTYKPPSSWGLSSLFGKGKGYQSLPAGPVEPIESAEPVELTPEEILNISREAKDTILNQEMNKLLKGGESDAQKAEIRKTLHAQLMAEYAYNHNLEQRQKNLEAQQAQSVSGGGRRNRRKTRSKYKKVKKTHRRR
jgi:hypothetical protein